MDGDPHDKYHQRPTLDRNEGGSLPLGRTEALPDQRDPWNQPEVIRRRTPAEAKAFAAGYKAALLCVKESGLEVAKLTLDILEGTL